MREKTLIIQDPVLKKGFTATPNAVLTAPALSLAAKALYSILLMFAWQNDECWPGQERLAQAGGCHINTVEKYLRELRDYGLISWKRQGLNRPNIYYIHNLTTAERLKKADSQGFVNPDSQGVVILDSQALVDKEDSVEKYNVVVVKKQLVENGIPFSSERTESQEKDISSGGMVDNVNSSEAAKDDAGSICFDAASFLPEEINRELAGIDMQLLGPAMVEVVKEYNNAEIMRAITVVKQQKQVDNLPGFFRTALEEGWEPGNPYPKSFISAGKKRKEYPGNRAGPEGRTREKKKEIVRSLYLN